MLANSCCVLATEGKGGGEGDILHKLLVGNGGVMCPTN